MVERDHEDRHADLVDQETIGKQNADALRQPASDLGADIGRETVTLRAREEHVCMHEETLYAASTRLERAEHEQHALQQQPPAPPQAPPRNTSGIAAWLPLNWIH